MIFPDVQLLLVNSKYDKQEGTSVAHSLRFKE